MAPGSPLATPMLMWIILIVYFSVAKFENFRRNRQFSANINIQAKYKKENKSKSVTLNIGRHRFWGQTLHQFRHGRTYQGVRSTSLRTVASAIESFRSGFSQARISAMTCSRWRATLLPSLVVVVFIRFLGVHIFFFLNLPPTSGLLHCALLIFVIAEDVLLLSRLVLVFSLPFRPNSLKYFQLFFKR